MRLISIALIGLTLAGCDNGLPGKVFLSNHALDSFDKSFVEVFVNEKLSVSESAPNRHLSFHWKESIVQLPNRDFKLTVVVHSNGYTIRKDTIVTGDSLFVLFDFVPYHKRYHNPEIFKYLPSETARLKEIADSLYANNVLANAREYLNDHGAITPKY